MKGYAAGDPTGVPGVVQTEHQTMRWRDCEWFRIPSGEIAVKLTFRFDKGERNQYEPGIRPAARTFTFLPTKGTRYEFDLALIMFGGAFNGTASCHP